MKKITLITGAASGLGKEFALLYGRQGNALLLVDKDAAGLRNTKEEISGDVEALTADLSKREELEKVYSHCQENGYFVNCLLNVAGFGDRCDFIDMKVAKQLDMTEVNCNAPLYFCRVFLPEMLQNGEGHIINVCSIAGFYPGPYMCTYHATKGFLLLLGESISYEIRKSPVKLLTLCPGPFESDFVKKAHNDYTFSKIKPVSAAYVAEYGKRKSDQGKSLAVIGFKNKLTVFASRFVSRRFIAKTSAKTMKKGA